MTVKNVPSVLSYTDSALCCTLRVLLYSDHTFAQEVMKILAHVLTHVRSDSDAISANVDITYCQ